MFKKIPVFWVVFSLLYLLVEILFRADVLNTASMAADTEELLTLERTGRTLASFGFAVFITSLFRLKSEYQTQTKVILAVLMIPIFLGSYLSANFLQQWAIDEVAESTPVAVKRDMMIANLTKEFAYFKQVNEKRSEPWLTSDEKVRLSFMPAMVLGDPRLDAYSNEKIKSVMADVSAAKANQNAHYSDNEVLRYFRTWIVGVRGGFTNITNQDNDFSGMTDKEAKLAYDYMIRDASALIRRAAKKSESDVARINDEISSYDQFKRDMEFNIDYAFREKSAEEIDYYMNSSSFMREFYYKGYKAQSHDRTAKILLSHNMRESSSDYHWLHAIMKNSSHQYKYYKSGMYLKDSCVAKSSSKNQIMILTRRSNKDAFSLQDKGFNQEDIDLKAKMLYVHLYGKSMRDPQYITCDYSYERLKKMGDNIKGYFQQTRVGYSPSLARKFVEQGTAQNHVMYKYAAMDAFSSLYYDQKGKLFIEHFKDLTEYDAFVKSVNLSSPQSFKNSVHAFMKRKAIVAFQKRAADAGLDFGNLVNQPTGQSFRYDHTLFYDNPKFMNVFRKPMPYAFTSSGRVIVNKDDFNSLPESSKQGLRQFYVRMVASQQYDMISNPDTFSEGGQFENAGTLIVKGFIAPSFVLAASNVMIILTLLNIMACLFRPFIGEYLLVLRVVSLLVFLAFPVFMKNGHVYSNAPSTEHPAVIRLASTTANMEQMFNVMFPSFIRPNGVYNTIKRAHKDREVPLQTHY